MNVLNGLLKNKWGTDAGSEQTAMLAAQEAGMGGGLMGGLGSAAGLLGPAGQALGAVSMAQGLLGGQKTPAPQVSNQTDGGAASAQLFNSIQQTDMQRMQEEIAKRQKLNGLFGGGNGWTS